MIYREKIAELWVRVDRGKEADYILMIHGLHLNAMFYLACTLSFCLFKRNMKYCQHLKIKRFHIKIQIPSFP